jgi:glycosyltransferase involved in cell wall biosynthesis
MTCTVIICTFNRCDSLRQTLESLCRLEVPGDVVWDVVVVDNNSTDATPEVCRSFADRLPLRRIFEPAQGLSHARNAGTRATEGDLVIFTDDDVDVEPGWLNAFCQAAQRHPDATFFGGKVLPRWETPPPKWVEETSAAVIPGVTMHYDRGDQERYLTGRDPTFFGANMAFRKSVHFAERSFLTSVGFSGGQSVPHEETAFIKSLMAAGHRGVYVPAATVHHRNPPTRATEEYVRKWFRGSGMGRVRLGWVKPRCMVAGAPLSAWWSYLTNKIKYHLTRRSGSSRTWVKALRKMSTAEGVIEEFRRQVHR